MSLEQLTREIQTIVGTTVDGVYGPMTADAVIKKLGIITSAQTLNYKTRAIQQHVNVWVDGIYGPKTANAILKAFNGDIEQPEPVVIDNKYPVEYKQTPNVSKSKIVPLGVVLHHSSGSFNGSVAWCTDPVSRVSYHVIVNTDGKRVVMAQDNERTWHAGVSSFKGKSNCNNFMLGVAVSGDTNNRELTDDEVESICEYILPRIKLHNWPRDLSTITTHRFVSPGRKDDVDVRAEKRILDALRAKMTL